MSKKRDEARVTDLAALGEIASVAVAEPPEIPEAPHVPETPTDPPGEVPVEPVATSQSAAMQLIDALRGLATNPRPSGCRKLSGGGNDWRIRVGDYRIIYEIADEIRIVRVNRVRHRRDAYR